MPDYGTNKQSTRKARRKDDQARVTAHAVSTGRSAKAQRRPDGDRDDDNTISTSNAAQVPTIAEEEESAGYVLREHVRRDIGSHVLVLDLLAEDSPGELQAFLDPDGREQRYAAQCLTHGEIAYFPGSRAATEAAKASHRWCPGCAELLGGTQKIQSKARAQHKASR